jgi:hypothetical protein
MRWLSIDIVPVTIRTELSEHERQQDIRLSICRLFGSQQLIQYYKANGIKD